MPLSRAAYRNFSATDINNRMSNTCDKSINGSNVDCTNANTTKIKNVLGVSDTALRILSRRDEVNVWSAWGPTVRSVSGGVLTNTEPADGEECNDFAGYNHSAPTPHFDSGGSNTYTLLQSGSDLVLSCVLDIGELLYNDVTGVANQATHIHFSVWDGASWVTNAAKIIALSSAVDGAGYSNSIVDFSQAGTRITISGVTSTKTYTCKIWFCSSDTFDYTGANKVFEMSQFASWTHQARVKSANHFYVNGPYNDGAATGASSFTSGRWTVNGAQLDLSTGYLDMNYLTLNAGLGSGWGDTGYDSLALNFIVQEGYYDQSGVWQGTTVSTSSNYVSGYSWNYNGCAVSSIVDFDIWTPGTGMDSSGYGYRIIINCTTS